MTPTAEEAVSQRWRDERERDARDLIAIRDTLALIDPARYPRSSKAWRAARECEDLAGAIESRFDADAYYCPKCSEGENEYAYSGRWTIRCAACGWTVAGATWDEALDGWNEEGSE